MENTTDQTTTPKKQYISEGRVHAFLICDHSLTDNSAEFYDWLDDEGFTFGGRKGNYGVCPWCYADITRKLYAFGMPGVQVVPAIGGHAITVDEFKTIYAIYKKYEGKEIFTFHTSRFDYDASD